MYTSKLKIKTSSVNACLSLCWWPDLSDCLVTSSISQGRPQKKPADHNCWDDGEARREDLGWQSKNVVWRRHWRQTSGFSRFIVDLCIAYGVPYAFSAIVMVVILQLIHSCMSCYTLPGYRLWSPRP